MTAHHDDSAATGAVVRKPPMKETALGERGAEPREAPPYPDHWHVSDVPILPTKVGYQG
jgi:hypothetical protein